MNLAACLLLGFSMGAAGDDDSEVCGPRWWERASLADVKELAKDPGGGGAHTACGVGRAGFLDLAAQHGPDPEIIDYPRGRGAGASPAALPGPKPAARTLSKEEKEGNGKYRKKSGWYLGFTMGPAFNNDISGIDHTGSNRDSFCYPDDLCFGDESSPPISGHRWSSELTLEDNAQPGSQSFTVGYAGKRVRFDLSYHIDSNSLERTTEVSLEKLVLSEYLPVVRNPESNVVLDVNTSMGRMDVRTFGLNTYYDFPRLRWVTPYVGIGAGLGFTEVTGARYSAKYRQTGGPQAEVVFDPPLHLYNVDTDDSNLHGNFLPTIMVHTGVDFDLGEMIDVGLRLTLSDMGGFEDQSHYSAHPMSSSAGGDPFPFTDAFGRTRKWRLDFIFTLK